jgi:uncharacterized protein YndB with AHSA1/START domain
VLRIALIVVAALVAIVLIVVAIGYSLPVAHTASREATLNVPPDRAFAIVTDVDAFPKWRGDVKNVNVLSRSPLRWREEGSNGTITFEMEEVQRPSRLVTRITDKNLPFGGSWLYELQPTANGTRLTVTERGEVYNPLFRFMSRYAFGHTATLDSYLGALRTHVGS